MRVFLIGLVCLAWGSSFAADAPPIWEALKLPDAAAGKALHAVCFTDDGKAGWIVGEGGLCVATTDGGVTWAAQTTGSTARLRDVRFNNPLQGWAVGEGDPAGPAPRGHVVMMPGMAMKSGTCLATEDGGKTWTNHWVPTNFELCCVETAAAPQIQIGNSGGARHLDGDNLRSANGGKQWKSERVFRAVFDVRRVEGERWALVGSPVAVGFMPTPTSALYTNKGCRALFSSDGGNSWQPSKGTEGLKGRGSLRALAVRAGQPVLAVGDRGAVAISTDAGQTWTLVDSGTQQNLLGVAYAGTERPVALAVGAKGTMLASADLGKTWKPVELGDPTDLLDVAGTGEHVVVTTATGIALRAPAVKLLP
ncbi:MAG: hypothetical protein AMXMBFR7_16370 [Planctomycetota bacterium]